MPNYQEISTRRVQSVHVPDGKPYCGNWVQIVKTRVGEDGRLPRAERNGQSYRKRYLAREGARLRNGLNVVDTSLASSAKKIRGGGLLV